MLDFFRSALPTDESIWVAILDLVIVFYLVYILLRLVRGTRTVPMAVGLLFFILLYVFSRQFGFVTTYLLLDQFMSVVVLFILIIFQDDIRRALVRLGRFAWFTRAKQTAILEEVVQAAERLTRAKIGGLIIFEREASLVEFVAAAGTRLEANVCRELLCAIFVPSAENVLHDGAVLIRNYQILEAGAFLPLSSNPKIDKALGTRHRAAIGISEQTDAVGVVISEERGTVSIAYRGELTRDISIGELRQNLLLLFSSESTRRKKLLPTGARNAKKRAAKKGRRR
ncbi:MAG: TIGR00159 family protein [Myxococcales bacterium]|jgi:diadenylate cyclase|nr:TIGR00159 family protein [Myxococcales bacterium]